MAGLGFINIFGRSYDGPAIIGVVGISTLFIHGEVSQFRDDVEILRKSAREDAIEARAGVSLARREFRDERIQSEARAERELTKSIASLKEAMVEASGAGLKRRR